MSGRLSVRNLQRRRRMDTRRLAAVARALLEDEWELRDFDIGIYLVGARRIQQLNEQFLRHAGPTDVMAFDYAEQRSAAYLSGEIFVCVDEALIQARRFQATWQTEVFRYIVHGLLHLRGYDDSRPAARRRMKHEEDRLLRRLTRKSASPATKRRLPGV